MAADSICAQLPEDALRDIAMRLERLGDLVAFASVCSSWRAAYKSIKPVWKSTMPWLIMAEDNDDNPQCRRTVVDLSTNRRYQMKLPETFGRHCWGCEHGWIFALSLDMETHHFNPLTRIRLSLPSAQTLPLKDNRVNYYDQRRQYIVRVHVISAPPNDELLVMVIYQPCGLAIAKPGDSKWVSIESHPYSVDLVHYGDSIAAVRYSLSLELTEVDFFLRMDDPFVEGLQYPLEGEWFLMPGFWYNLYLANDPLGGILAVFQYVSKPDIDDDIHMVSGACLISHFMVLSLDDSVDEAWLTQHDLGDRALFVGNSAAVCVVASKCPNCKPNCIYFTDGPGRSSEFIGHDTGIFNMEDQSIERVYHGVDILSRFCPPFWFMPKLV